MLVMVIRSILLYGLVMFSLRMMGKRQVGQLQPAELVIAIMISDVASIPMQNTGVPLISGVVPILVLLIAEVAVSYVGLKCRCLRIAFSGSPSVLIHKGVLDEREMERQRFNIDDLLEELRVLGYPDVSEIEFAILETGGQISVIPKAAAKAVTCGDLQLKIKQEVMPYILISDGVLEKTELTRAGKTEAWLQKQLKQRHIRSIKEVFLASLNGDGALFVQTKQRKGKR